MRREKWLIDILDDPANTNMNESTSGDNDQAAQMMTNEILISKYLAPVPQVRS